MDWTGSTSIEFLERLFFFLTRFEMSKIEKAQFAIWGNRKQIFNVHSYPTSVSASIRLSWNFTGKRVSRSVIVVGFRFRRVKASNRIHPNRFCFPRKSNLRGVRSRFFFFTKLLYERVDTTMYLATFFFDFSDLPRWSEVCWVLRTGSPPSFPLPRPGSASSRGRAGRRRRSAGKSRKPGK